MDKSLRISEETNRLFEKIQRYLADQVTMKNVVVKITQDAALKKLCMDFMESHGLTEDASEQV